MTYINQIYKRFEIENKTCTFLIYIVFHRKHTWLYSKIRAVISTNELMGKEPY